MQIRAVSEIYAFEHALPLIVANGLDISALGQLDGMFAAIVNGALVGFAGFTLCSSSGIAYLRALCVKDTYRLQDCARRLVQRVVQSIDASLYKVRLLPAAAMKSFYERLGFCEIAAAEAKAADTYAGRADWRDHIAMELITTEARSSSKI